MGPSSRSCVPADPLVHDLTVCARRALRRAAAQERAEKNKPQQQQQQQQQTRKPTTTSGSLEHRVGSSPETPLKKKLLKPLVLKKASIIDKLKQSPLYKESATPASALLLKQKEREEGRERDPSEERCGPINWSLDDLRSKYRDEIHREAAWRASSADCAAARHPLITDIMGRIATESAECLGHARIRSVSRRFVLDVHQIWLTNLEHLSGGRRHARCDGEAIRKARSQIQSVAQSMACRWRHDIRNKMSRVVFVEIDNAPLPSPAAPAPRPSLRLANGDEGGFVRLSPSRRRWHVALYDSATSTERNFVVADDKVRPIDRLPPPAAGGNRARVHRQVARISTTKGGPRVRCFVEIYYRAPCHLELVAATTSTSVVRRMTFTTLDVAARTGLEAPLLRQDYWLSVKEYVWRTVCDELCLTRDDGLRFLVPRSVENYRKALRLVATNPVESDERSDDESESDDDDAPSLSLQVCGHADRCEMVPGTCWDVPVGLATEFVQRSSRDRCEYLVDGRPLVARDRSRPVYVASPSKRVVVDLALDCGFLAPQHVAVDPRQLQPPRRPPEEKSACMSFVCGLSSISTTFFEELPPTTSLSATMMALTGCADPRDYDDDDQDQRIKGHRRTAATFTPQEGFRTKTIATTSIPDQNLDPSEFCVARSATTTPPPSLAGRFVQHSTEHCSDELHRSRTVDDFLYVSKARTHAGFNDPRFYCAALEHFAFKRFVRDDRQQSVAEQKIDCPRTTTPPPRGRREEDRLCETTESQAGGKWRRFYREKRPLLQDPRTQGPSPESLPAPQSRIVGLVAASSCTSGEADADLAPPPTETMFLQDPIRASVLALENRSADAQSSSDDVAKDRLVLQAGLSPTTTTTDADSRAQLEEEAILAAKSGDVDKLEECLERDVFVDQVDRHGNSLLILAVQTNHKKAVKALLRRGANLNAQNALGNTALHFCTEYRYDALFDYLLAKGADDQLLNARGLTCYEGLDVADDAVLLLDRPSARLG